MKITLEGSETIKFVPENEHEEKGLDALWKLVIRCDEDSKILSPIGNYMPGTDEGAYFQIEDRQRSS